jgi:hypothetical protein
LKSKFEIDLE